MLEQGGLLTDFSSETNPDRENFLKRNRLIAGLADATVVVESAERGGALVTADIACSYDGASAAHHWGWFTAAVVSMVIHGIAYTGALGATHIAEANLRNKLSD